MKRLIRDYVTDRNYAYLYGQNVFKSGAFLSMGLFIGGWLFQLGLPFHLIIAYYALSFLCMGLLSPFGSYMANRFGLTRSFGVAYLFYFLGLISLSFAQDTMAFVLLGLVLNSIANGLHNPVDMMVHAIYVKDHNRGRAVSIINALSSLMTMISVLLGGWLVESTGFFGISGVCGVLFLFSLICISRLDDRIKNTGAIGIAALYPAVFKPENRDVLGVSLGFQFLVVGSLVLVPVVLYTAVEDFRQISVIASIALIIQMIVVMLQGVWVDRKIASIAPLRFALKARHFRKTPLAAGLSDIGLAPIRTARSARLLKHKGGSCRSSARQNTSS